MRVMGWWCWRPAASPCGCRPSDATPWRRWPSRRGPTGPPSTEPLPALFVARARGHDRGFELTDDNAGAVAAICSRLDGLPLAIELAAARITLLDPDELNARLAQALDVLGTGPRDVPDRQRTLRATVDWSHSLLGASRREHSPAWPSSAAAHLDAAQEVTGADLDTLAGVIDKHLVVRRHEREGPRILMLETVHQYAHERLAEQKDAGDVYRRHCLYYLALTERAEPEWFTHGEGEWLPRFEAEIDNLRAALDWGLHHGDPALALRMASLLAMFWETSGRQAEGLGWPKLRWAGSTLTRFRSRIKRRALRARVHLDEGALFATGAALEQARARAAEALTLSRRTGDPAAIADALLGLAGLEMGERFLSRAGAH